METWKICLMYIVFLGVSITFSVLINGLFLRFSRNLGVRNFDDTIIRWGTTSKPSLGGISFYIIFLLSIISFSIFSANTAIFLNISFLGLLGATTLAFMMGLADDAYNTRPFLKFLAQVACGVSLVLTGTSIQFFSSDILNYILTILWVVGMMNSLNMLDNMDGITTIVSLSVIISAIIIIIYSYDVHNIDMTLLIGVAGALIGFLVYNWHPSKMYMGDTGSQFIGFFLAAMGIRYFWNNAHMEPQIPSRQLISVLIVFILPITDTLTVVINRISSGRSPFVGGKDHTTHHLSYLGYSDRQVALIFAALSFLSIVTTFFMFNAIDAWSHLYTILFFLYFLIISGSLFYITKRNERRKKLQK